MKQPLRSLIAGLTLTAATLTGSVLTSTTATADDTTPPATTTGPGPNNDTWWGTPPTDGQPAPAPRGPAAAPFDTWWG